MFEIVSFRDLLDPRKIDLLDSSFEQIVTSFGESGVGLFAVVAAEYRKQAKARLFSNLEKRFLREKLQKLIISTGNVHIVRKEKNASNEIYTEIKNAMALFRGMTMKNNEDDIKFLRILSKVYDEKCISSDESEEFVAVLKARGRWHFILDFLEAKIEEMDQKSSLDKLLLGMNRHPENYRCFFLGINNMEFDQLGEDEELIKLKVGRVFF
jgi:23S rRNA maturation mini-RNase III